MQKRCYLLSMMFRYIKKKKQNLLNQSFVWRMASSWHDGGICSFMNMSVALLCKRAYHDVPWTFDTMTVVYSNKLNMSENVSRQFTCP